MKKLFTLFFVIGIATNQSKSQAVLNEIYSIPSGGRHEFFELYNKSASSVPESMDTYTLLTYFQDQGNVRGFYVMDLPAISVAPKGYFVGAAANPFNYQGVTNATANFSWNNLPFMAANNAYLRRWVLGTSVPAAVDGNSQYDQQAVPANVNDIFLKIGGGSVSYNVFLYKNGVIVNSFLGGIGGSAGVPSYITTMPPLYIDMLGAAPDFTIDFPSYTTINAESVVPEAGSDNGYIRSFDGFCGTWVKSSAQVNHTPGVSNHGTAEYPTGSVSVQAAVAGGSSSTGSTLNYDIVGAPASFFPITMDIYTDIGSTTQRLDNTDGYVASQTEISLTDGPFSTVFHPHNAHILIVTSTNEGCIDNIRFIPTVGVLPVRLTSFAVRTEVKSPVLEWSVTENETIQKMEVESGKSAVVLTTKALVFSSNQPGQVSYQFKDAGASNGSNYYRIKITDKNNRIIYSPILQANVGEVTEPSLTIRQNPVQQQLQLNVTSHIKGLQTLVVYQLSGHQVGSWQVYCEPGVNSISLSLPAAMRPGGYIVQLQDGSRRNTQKFIKQ